MLSFFPCLTARLPESKNGAQPPLCKPCCSKRPWTASSARVSLPPFSQGKAKHPQDAAAPPCHPALAPNNFSSLRSRLLWEHHPSQADRPVPFRGKMGTVLQRTRLFIGNIELKCNLTNDSNLNRLILRPQSGKRKKPLFSKGHNGTFNRFFQRANEQTNLPFTTQMK